MKRKIAVAGAVTGGLWLLLAGTASAQTEVPEGVVSQVILDNLWVFIAGVLVFFMQAGFALVEAGLTRAKNVANIMMKNLMDMSAGVLAFALIGFGIGFSGSEQLGGWFGWGGFFLDGFESTEPFGPQPLAADHSSSSRPPSQPRRRRSCRAPWPSGRSSSRTSCTRSSSPP